MPSYRRKFLPYNPKLRERARRLRKDGTLGEVLLWHALKTRALGCEFHRQVPIADYIVDFFCHERMLAIEVDGASHDQEAYARDLRRQQELEVLGVRFLRFSESAVRQELDGVLQAIAHWLEEEDGGGAGAQ